MTLSARYASAITARRAFTLPGYPTLTQAGFDGDYVCPIQMTSGNLTGPMLISKDWLDAPSVARHHTELSRTGYLATNPYNRVIDKVLALLNLTRADIYITPIFHLLTPQRSSQIPAAEARASFEAVGQYELLDRHPVALGHDSARVLRHFDVPHITAPHPSARIGTFDAKAEQIRGHRPHMTAELTVLTLAALLQVVQFALMAIPANLEVGTAKTLSPRDPKRLGGSLQDLVSPRTGRLIRALNNHFEALILFTIAVLIITLSDQSTPVTQTCAWVYLLARVAYIPAYAFGWTPWRSLIWGVGFGATIAMLLAALL